MEKQCIKKRRKFFSVILVVALVFSTLSVPFGGTKQAYAVETPSGPLSGTVGNITWKLTEDTPENWDLAQGTPYKLTLTGKGSMPDINYNLSENRPWLNYAPFITSLSISEGITSIGQSAFEGCSSLTYVKIPDSVTSIESSAFFQNSLLTTVVFGANVKTVEYHAFGWNPSLTTVEFNDKLESIGPMAFSSCKKLKNVTLPDSLKTIVDYAFGECGFTDFTVPKGVVSIGRDVFQHCYSLEKIRVAEGNSHFQVIDSTLYEMKEGHPFCAVVLPYKARLSDENNLNIPEATESIADGAFSFHSEITKLTLPSTLKTIGGGAFSHISITELTLPDAVERLEQNAFSGNTKLNSLTIGKGLQNMEYNSAFASATSLSSITVSDANPNFTAVEDVLYSKDHTVLYLYASAREGTVYHALKSLEKIKSGAIWSAANLEELYLPETVSYVDLRENSKLKSIYFYGNAPETASIYENAANLILYKTADSTGWDAAKWSQFVVADWDKANITEDAGVFGEVSWQYKGSNGSIIFTGTGKVPDFSEEEAPWSDYIDVIQTIDAEDGITGIGADAFAGADKLLRVVTGKSFETVGEDAFAECPALLFADMEHVKTIGAHAFRGDTALKSALTLKETFSIGEGAFMNCSSLTEVMLGEKLSGIEKDVFSGCTKLQDIILPESITAIGQGAFAGCSKLRTVNIPAAAKTIDQGAFAGDTALCKVYFYGVPPQEWADDSFSDCMADMKIYYRRGQRGWDAFSGSWNGIGVEGLDRFYTEQEDYYSFDNSAAAFGYQRGYRVPRQRYVDVLDSIVKGSYYYALNTIWGGSCFGMTGSTLGFYEGMEQLEDYGAGTTENLYALKAPNSQLTKLIEAYQVSQYHSAVSDSIYENTGQYQKLIQKVEEFERSGGLRVDSEAEPVVMTIYGFFGGHAVVPVSVQQTKNGDFEMKVYDPNYPEKLRTLTIRGDYSGISYGWYFWASYVEYTSIADVMDGITLYNGGGDTSLYVSVNKENVSISDASGNEFEKINGAYEQRHLSDETEDVFGGIRSFVLPEGAYELSANDEKEEDVTFYLAGQDAFAEVVSSDEKACLSVSQEDAANGLLQMKLHSDDENQTTVFTLMNAVGMEHEIRTEGKEVEVSLLENDSFKVVAADGTSVTIDGEKVQTEDGTVEQTFLSEGKAAFRVRELQAHVSCDAQNRLSGTVEAALVANRSTTSDVTVRSVFLNGAGKQVASYSEEKTLVPGINDIGVSFEALAATFEEQEGETELTCRFELEYEDENVVSEEVGGLTVTLTKQETLPEVTDKPDVTNPPEATAQPNVTDKPEITNSPEITNPPKTTDKPEGTSQPNVTSSPNITNKPETTNAPNDKIDGRVKVKRIRITAASKKVAAGKTTALSVDIFPKNALNNGVSYRVSNRGYASVKNGIFKAKKAGAGKTVTVTATAKGDSSIKDAIRIRIMKHKVKKVTITSRVTEVKAGKSITLRAVVQTSGKDANKKLKWISSNEKYATVNAKGKVKTTKAGKGKSVTIMAVSTDGTKKKAKITIKVR